MDITPPPPSASPSAAAAAAAPPGAEAAPRMTTAQAFPAVRQGLSEAEVALQLNRAASTVHDYLIEFLRHERITDPAAGSMPSGRTHRQGSPPKSAWNV